MQRRAFDHIVLTAANEAQARGYREQLRVRAADGLLPPDSELHVVPDPLGRRVGSLGATLHAMAVLARRLARGRGGAKGNPLAGRRILILHSGGDSRRLPAYAAEGKVFLPLPALTAGGTPACLFDLILEGLSALRAPDGGHVLVASGDVLLTFDPAEVRFCDAGVTGVAYPAEVRRGAGHGVYVTAGGATRGFWDVAGFIQKPSPDEAERAGAVSDGRVLVDTGLLSISASCAGQLLGAMGGGRGPGGGGILAAIEKGIEPPLDIYEEFALSLVPGLTAAQYRARLKAGGRSGAADATVRALHKAMRGVPFRVNVLSDCDFFHIGTSRELLANMDRESDPSARRGFDRRFLALVGSDPRPGEGWVLSSVVASLASASGPCVVERAETQGALGLAGSNIVVGVPAEAGEGIVLPPRTGLVCLPVGAKAWAAVSFGVEDDFKSAVAPAGGATFANKNMREWLGWGGVADSDVWPDGVKRDLWEARLWVCGTAVESVAHAVALLHGADALRRCHGRRLSMSDLIRLVNQRRLLDQRRRLQRRVEAGRFEGLLAADRLEPAAALAAGLTVKAERAAVVAKLRRAVRQEPHPLVRARAWEYARQFEGSGVPGRPGGAARGERYTRRSLDCISEAVEKSVVLPAEPRRANVLQGQVIWVTTPVRIDLAGGWSDTPPICLERGGSVVNAAVTLNGQYPVQVIARLSPDPVVRLTSIDLGERAILRTSREVLDHRDPGHWAALPKCALVVAGLAPSDAGDSLRQWLDVLGGGIDLTVFAGLPKGSGMGTSSILGAAVLAACARLVGGKATPERLFAMTSVVEQRMRTGGGWQDQVGGVTPGVKLITTRPGFDQATEVTPLAFNRVGRALEGRVLLYYTGIQRMARGILHQVVRRYLGRDPMVVETVAELKQAAEQMRACMEAGDADGVAETLEWYWTLKKRMDPQATNAPIESIFRRVGGWCAGSVVAGAGGGGFVMMIARDAAAARAIRRELERRPATRTARFFDFAIDEKGLQTTVM